MNISKTYNIVHKSKLCSCLPALLAIFTLCFLVVIDSNVCYSALPQTLSRYNQAKAKLQDVIKDATKSKQRERYEQLAREFLDIYESDKTWSNRPAALFRAALTFEELAKRSFRNQDALTAINYYKNLAQNHRASPLADDALYHAAKLEATLLGDGPKALKTLAQIKKTYAKGDMLTDALALEKSILADPNRKVGQEVRQTVNREVKPTEEQLNDHKNNAQQAALVRQYELAKSKMQRLLADNSRSCWRQPWENLETEFLGLHKKIKNQTIAAGALFRAAQSRHNLARCTHQKNDFRRAVEIYQTIPEKFAQSNLADDALFQAAQILTDNLDNKRQSQKLLTEILKRYPTSDMAAQARNDLRKMTAEDGKKHVQLQVLTWDSLDKNKVKITLEFTGKAEYSAKLVDNPKNKVKKQLFIDLNDIYIAQSIRKGVVIRGSLLQGIFVEHNRAKQSILRFDLKDAKRFQIKRQPQTNNLVIIVDASKNVVPMDEKRGDNVASSFDLDQKSVSTHILSRSQKRNVNDMARQLGLSIHTIFIDAGHGGKDPGTYHNNIVERLVTLDVAKTLGRLLENNGFKVIYSRTTDRFISLSQRTLAANMARADLFISIHVNAHENPEANGFETYYLDLSRSPHAARVAALENAASDRRLGDLQKVLAEIMLTAKVDESSRLAIDIQRVTISRLKRNGSPARNNGVKSAPFHVLIGAQMPAVLVELGYCSNPKEAAMLANAQYRESLATGLAEGIMAYRDRLTKQHTVENSLTQPKSGAM